MRYMLIPVLVCAFGAPTAFALPPTRPAATEASPPDQVLLVARKSPAPKPAKKHATKAKSKGLGGIHPLVGSGDY